MINKVIFKEVEVGGKKMSFEVGNLAYQANMAIKATYGDTVILVTAVSGGLNPDLDFFPLTVNYDEKLYASGTIKSSRFVKRDGRPTDEAIITKRLADHAIRPLFPSDFKDEVQVAGFVLSLDEESDPEVLFMNTISACLMASDIPWNGPMVTARVGYVDGAYVLNPSKEVLHNQSDLDMTVSFVGDDLKFLAVEAEANILPEAKILGAMEFARNNLKEQLELIKAFAKEVNPKSEKYEYESVSMDPELVDAVNEIAKDKVISLMKEGLDKTIMKERLAEIFEETYEKLEGKYKKADIQEVFMDIEKHALQSMILDDGKRPDGREITDVREIKAGVGILPRTHGSGLFSRGVTQVMTVATLGSPSMEMIIQDMYGEDTKRYMHFYNMPPFASGETGRIGGYPKNREIGHGMLAEKALKPVIPDQKEFPYTIILVSETLSSSGSTSMAATCGSTLALMDAGVPIKDMVAGVGVGLIVNDDMSKRLVMTDLAYMEDAFGFLDFKMTGTKDGVTAIQCDMKSEGIPMDLLPKIVEQSREGRLHVLEEMKKAISKPRETVSEYAPKMVRTIIDPDKIGLVIGAGGKTIKEIQENTQTTISIEEDGTVVASADTMEQAQRAIDIVEGMTKELEIGDIFDGVVKEVLGFGAFVEVAPGKDGLLHISELAEGFVENVEDYISVGDTVKVQVIGTSPDGKFSLSKNIKDVDQLKEEVKNNSNNSHSRGGNSRRRNSGGRNSGGRGDRRSGRRNNR